MNYFSFSSTKAKELNSSNYNGFKLDNNLDLVIYNFSSRIKNLYFNFLIIKYFYKYFYYMIDKCFKYLILEYFYN